MKNCRTLLRQTENSRRNNWNACFWVVVINLDGTDREETWKILPTSGA